MKNLTQSVCSRYKNEITHVSELEKRLSKFESKLQDVLAKLERLKGVESELVHEKASFEQSLKKLWADLIEYANQEMRQALLDLKVKYTSEVQAQA